MTRWILVTGGVAADIGKGTLAAMLGRRIARAGRVIRYQKLEPCVQAGLEGLVPGSIGEIVQSPIGFLHDGDVARAAFWIPGFVPRADSDLSLGTLLHSIPVRLPSPRLGSRIAGMLPRSLTEETLIVELGGTTGEPEHGLMLDAAVRAWGAPGLHVHVTVQVRLPGSRSSTKPAQASIDALKVRPDVVFLRGGTAAGALRDHVPHTPIIEIAEDTWPERACWQALNKWEAAPKDADDPVFSTSDGRTLFLDVRTDGFGQAAYESLFRRLRAWSRGRIAVGRRGATAIIRIGESPTPAAADGKPTLSIVPHESGLNPRDPAARPDWHGTADRPSGPLAEFLGAILRQADADAAPTSARSTPYAFPAFADVYQQNSRAGSLRDHAALDALLARCLPAPLSGRRILDVGCGDGRLAARFVADGATVVGVEPCAPMADAAIARGLPQFTLARCRAEDLAVDGIFDGAVAWMSLDHCADAGRALRRIAAHLRPGARLIVTTEHALRTAPESGERWHHDSARVRDYASSGWREFYWFGRPEPVPVYHRPIGEWVSLGAAASLGLMALSEPAGADDHGVPRFQLLLFERPDPLNRTITLDGPAGCGKSTLGDALARALGAVHVDTGRLVRTLAYRELVGGTLTSEIRDFKYTWLINGQDPGDRINAPELLARCAVVENEAVLALVRESSRSFRIVSGRAWGRTLSAACRLWLQTPLEIRASRRGVTEQSLASRDAVDEARGRLLPPDLAAVSIDGGLSLAEVADSAVAAASTVRRRSQDGSGVESVPAATYSR